MSWEDARAEFPALERCVYLNTATSGQIPNRALRALQSHFDVRNEQPAADFNCWFDDLDRIRAAIGQLVGCSGDDVAFVQNASAALSLLLGGIEWRRGDQILSIEGEFPNQLYYPALLAAKGVELVLAPPGELLEHVTEQTRLVAISSVVYSTGYVPPVEQIGQTLRERGILFYLDGTQSVGARQIDLRRVQPDLFAVHGYKWMMAPHGAAFVCVSPAVRAWLNPAVVGWRSDRDWRSASTLNQGEPRFCETAAKYEGGMLNFSVLYALGETVQMMLEEGPARIESRVLELASRVCEVLEGAGAQVLHRGSNIVAARFPRHDASLLVEGLKRQGVVTVARQGNIRVSAHFYNNGADMEAFGRALNRLL